MAWTKQLTREYAAHRWRWRRPWVLWLGLLAVAWAERESAIEVLGVLAIGMGFVAGRWCWRFAGAFADAWRTARPSRTALLGKPIAVMASVVAAVAVGVTSYLAMAVAPEIAGGWLLWLGADSIDEDILRVAQLTGLIAALCAGIGAGSRAALSRWFDDADSGQEGVYPEEVEFSRDLLRMFDRRFTDAAWLFLTIAVAFAPSVVRASWVPTFLAAVMFPLLVLNSREFHHNEDLRRFYNDERVSEVYATGPVHRPSPRSPTVTAAWWFLIINFWIVGLGLVLGAVFFAETRFVSLATGIGFIAIADHVWTYVRLPGGEHWPSVSKARAALSRWRAVIVAEWRGSAPS